MTRPASEQLRTHCSRNDLNGTIELYEYFFSALIGAELTQKQGVVFRYIAHLLVNIPGASIHTLRQLMEDGTQFKPYMEKLPGSARVFFETRFFDRTFSETKKQILTRLFGVLANQALDRMMGSSKNSVDLFRALQNGAIVFINTAKDFLGHEGSAIFSRMFIALLGQALIRRASVPKHERTPTYIYIDEAQDAVDLTLTRLLSQVRKYKGAITFAHQNLDQLSSDIRAGVIANTSIKLAGGLSAKDANALSGDFRVDSAFLLGQRKGKRETHFACFAKNVTEHAVSVPIPFGFVEQNPSSSGSYALLVEHSRKRYGVAAEPELLLAPMLATESPPPPAVAKPQAAPTQPTRATTTFASFHLPQTRTLGPLVPAKKPAAPVRQPSPAMAASPAPPTLPAPKPFVPLLEQSNRGAKHKYLQHLVKELGEARGFRATLEQPVHDGTGRVDVVLVRNELQIAFEISVTTTKDHELGNVEKCLALPFTHVVMMASNARHLKGLQAHIGRVLEESEATRMFFLLSDSLPGFLDKFAAARLSENRTVKGYTVRSRLRSEGGEDAHARRSALAKLVAHA